MRAVNFVCVFALVTLGQVHAQSNQGTSMEEATSVLRELVETYGVSSDESRVRDVVRRHLPAWAQPTIDTAGNLWVRAGQGDPVVVFVAHMDETGFRVSEIAEDGTLLLQNRGGFSPWLWEATPALVHTGDSSVPGVFVPRSNPEAEPGRASREPARVDTEARASR